MKIMTQPALQDNLFTDGANDKIESHHNSVPHSPPMPAVKELEEVRSTPDVFDATLDCSAGLPIGIGIKMDIANTALSVEIIQEGGAAAKWNAGHPDKLIEPGHLIVKVNDKEGNLRAMVNECSRSKCLEFKVMKPFL
eukprot:CAMPEP_0194495336 /NCGR_PEP_ID=MMETSP0253-20130528/12976_1 /TAXON_ID=2966 /ORGANISM="Noctiluca scintillans" /LENGTH=137 /DNA_ID=CAMNT_0039336583 /DNA_START=116 /DNA_END=529 /DNA_ORIENTATION=-